MTPEIHEQFEKLKLFSDSIAQILLLIDEDELKEFEEQARRFSDGTLAPILVHHMSIQDLTTSEKNLKHAIEVSRTLRKLKGLLVRISDPESEAA